MWQRVRRGGRTVRLWTAGELRQHVLQRHHVQAVRQRVVRHRELLRFECECEDDGVI